MKKILFLIISVLMVFGCSKENEEVVGHNRMSYEEFCNKYFSGYLVNDTTKLVNLTKEVKYNQDETTYFVGTKNQKLWIGLFDTKTKKCIKEYVSHDEFPLDFTYDLGYGKTEIAHMDYLNVNNLFETQKGFACSISSQYSLYTIYIFNSIQTKYYLYREYNVYKGLSEWYDNTFLMQYNINNENNTLCLNEVGEILFDGYMDRKILSLNYTPTNLKDYIYINYDNDYIFIKNGTLQNNEATSHKRLNLFSRTEDKEIFTCEFRNIKNNILEIYLILTGISGDILNKTYKVNIQTFELEQ